MDLKKTILVILFAFLVVSPLPSLASGSYGGRPPRPPSSSDRALYTIGKSLIAGKIALQDVADADSQGMVLAQLQDRLPKSARQKIDLMPFAGKLTDQQLEGLKSYLKVRYKIK